MKVKLDSTLFSTLEALQQLLGHCFHPGASVNNVHPPV